MEYEIYRRRTKGISHVKSVTETNVNKLIEKHVNQREAKKQKE